MLDLHDYIRDIPDFPSPGIVFKDMTPLLADREALAVAVARLAEPWEGRVDVVVGIEARGFILGAPVAARLGTGFVPLRKAGKLPGATVSHAYDLEYGSATLEVHADAFDRGARVLVVDDVLATGGTAAASAALVSSAGGVVAGMAFLMVLSFLDGAAALPDVDVVSLLTY